MPKMFSIEMPRALTPDEDQRLSDMVAAMFTQFEWEREQPVHICELEHGKLEMTGVGIVDGIAQVGLHYTEAPTCHDCGRDLQRPRGASTVGWICPSVANHSMRAKTDDGVVECGQTRT